MLGAAAALAFFIAAVPAKAQTRAETLRYVTGAAVNTLDPEYSRLDPRSLRRQPLDTYDRLVSFGRKQLNGNGCSISTRSAANCAESYVVSPDGLKITFKPAQRREIPGRLAGHGRGREVVARPRRHRQDPWQAAQLLTGSLTDARASSR